ncbi:crossover junction endodeoxyribonuclease RuvC [Aquicella lusitana]|uniref:Crossover junction endodeoxyribonuclease RuvC n=1 Tax=Aquicella lusitana TaxID=254246 RepID=A0A370GDF7_9COXI|nr:crossover junction endodeoxyribonuclease RuvC [Aquicella lusitana]RDI41828.1 Holliday junction endonuclease RuvC [Aquicella lusitana]VVC73736.1 Crossover junction endodeoxyribonuclease RuvC [Aquicella lusitana]
MTIILGIDPGSRRTGYGVIRVEGNRHIYLTSGYLDLTSYPACERLRQIFLGLQQLIQSYRPQEAAIEQIFMHENPNSALKLGQARGAAIVALDMPVTEYSARQVKKSVVGIGAANKEQVQYMVKRLLNLSGSLQPDAADALAVALCHAHARNLRNKGVTFR